MLLTHNTIKAAYRYVVHECDATMLPWNSSVRTIKPLILVLIETVKRRNRFIKVGIRNCIV